MYSEMSPRRNTLSFVDPSKFEDHIESLLFKVGGEIMTMTWNLQDCDLISPFEFYMDLRDIIGEQNYLLVRVLLDVARVYLSLNAPLPASETITLNQIIPAELLLPKHAETFIKTSNIDRSQAACSFVRNYGSRTVRDFLIAHALVAESKNPLQGRLSLPHLKTRMNTNSNPTLSSYKPKAYQTVLKDDPLMLPILIFDAIQLFVVNLSFWLTDNGMNVAFSEYGPEEQSTKANAFLQQWNLEAQNVDPKFVAIRNNLWKKWRNIFTSENKVTQVYNKVNSSKSDIVFFQGINKALFSQLKSNLKREFQLIPEKFPPENDSGENICVIACRKTAIKCKDLKIKKRGDRMIAVRCTPASSAIGFWACCMHLDGQRGFEDVKAFVRQFGHKQKLIIAGDFNKDLATSNDLSDYLLKSMNGIDHNQEAPLAYSVNKTRTNLQYQLQKGDLQDAGVKDGVFSTFPLLGQAFTDYNPQGGASRANPSDHCPVFQNYLSKPLPCVPKIIYPSLIA